MRQSSKLEKSRVARSGAPARLWRQRARGVRVEFTLQLRRQSDRREVLEFHIIGNPESATNRSLAISPWVIRKTHAGSEVVLVRLGVAEGDDSRRVGNRVQGLSARSDRIRPVFVPQAQVHGEARCEFEVVLDEPAEQALGAQETPRSGVAQRSSRIVRPQVVDEGVCRLVLIVTVAPGQEELRINEVIVLATKLECVLSLGPGKGISNLIRVLFLRCVVARPHGHPAEQVVDGDVLRARCARVEGIQREVRILQA